MKLTIELDREVDGRWIAEVPELNVLVYGATNRTLFGERSRSRAKSFWIGSHIPSYLLNRQSLHLTLRREFLAVGEGPTRFGSVETHRMAA